MSEKEGPIDFVKWFSEVGKDSIKFVGGKGANLGEIYNLKIPVPPGFALSAYAYKRFISETGIDEKIYSLIKETITDIVFVAIPKVDTIAYAERSVTIKNGNIF